jgi:hypothetical protein
LADQPISPASESFSRELRRVLQHLYDWVELSKSPFLALFDLKQRHDPPEALRDILRKAIEALKPVTKVSPKAKVWRTYQILYTRYMEQFTQKEVAELGLVFALRREESLAVQTLAAYLWDRYDLAPRWQPLTARLLHSNDPQAQPDVTTPTSEQELGWVQASLPSQPVSVAKTIEAALKLITPLPKLQVQIDTRIPPSLPGWIIQVTPVHNARWCFYFRRQRAPQEDCAQGASGRAKIRLRIEAVA